MKKILVLLLCIVSASTNAADFLVISDIDDTIKISNVRNPEKYIRSMDTQYQFTGMSELYNELLQQHRPSIHFAYITNASEKILGMPIMKLSHQKFLKNNNFPAGDFFIRQNLDPIQHKLTAIRRVIAERQPKYVLFLGDNAEFDVQIYQTAQRELAEKNIPSNIFIHRLHKDAGPSNETYFSYVTSIEVAARLSLLGNLDAARYETFVNTFLPRIKNEITENPRLFKRSSFPDFIDCRDFKWTLPLDVTLRSLHDVLLFRCHPSMSPKL